MKNKKMILILIIILSILAIALLGGLILYLSNPNIVFSVFQQSETLVEKTYSLEEIEHIKVDASSQKIKIIKQEADNISIKVTGYGKEEYSIGLQDKELVIKKEKGFLCFGFCMGKEEVLISIPEESSIQFTLQTSSGDIEIEDFPNSVITTDTSSGDINIKGAQAIYATASSGDIEIGTVSKGNFKTSSGDIDILSFDVTENGSITTSSGDVSIENIKNAYIETSTNSGEVNISNSDHFAPYTINIKTSSGDISAN